MTKSVELCLIAQLRFPIVIPARHDATESFAALAQENADETGDDFPLLDASRPEVPPRTVPLPHDIPVPHTRRIPLDTRALREIHLGLPRDSWEQTCGLYAPGIPGGRA
jgi:hypothetical protein